MLVHASATLPGKAKCNGPHHTIKMLQFVLFRGVTCYTNSTASRIHVNTTKLYDITCTLVAIGVILQSLECISELHGIILGTRSGCSPKNYPMKGPADYLTTVSKEVGLETTVAPTGRKSCLLLLHHPVTHACLPARASATTYREMLYYHFGSSFNVLGPEELL